MFDCTKDLPLTEWHDRLRHLAQAHALVKIGTVTEFPKIRRFSAPLKVVSDLS